MVPGSSFRRGAEQSEVHSKKDRSGSCGNKQARAEKETRRKLTGPRVEIPFVLAATRGRRGGGGEVGGFGRGKEVRNRKEGKVMGR